MSNGDFDICKQIRSERRFGLIRCGVVFGQHAAVEAARAFGLNDDVETYTPIVPAEADQIAIRILSVSLANGTEIMSIARAADLWQRFLELFASQPIRFISNGPAHLDSWTPATKATFDRGLLVLSGTHTGCLWVEEED